MYTRTIDIIKEVTRNNILLKIPLIRVIDMSVESWTISPTELQILLSKKEPLTSLEKEIWNTYTYPGERQLK
jgi:hypothetical protein